MPNPAARASRWINENLGDRSVFGWQLFLIYLFFTLMVRNIAYDFRGLDVFQGKFSGIYIELFWITLPRLLFAFAALWLAKRFIKKSRTPIHNLIFVAAFGLIGYLVDAIVFPNSPTITKYGLGSALIFAVAVTLIIYSVSAPFILSSREFVVKYQQLQIARIKAAQFMADAEIKLRVDEKLRTKQLQRLLLPTLRQLSKTLRANESPSADTVEEIQQLVDSRVRPLSSKLLDKSPEIPDPTPLVPKFRRSVFLKSQVNVRSVLRPEIWGLLLFPLFVAGIASVFGGQAGLLGILTSIIWIAVFVGVKFLVPKKTVAPVWLTAFGSGLLGVLIWLPLDYALASRFGSLDDFIFVTQGNIRTTFIFVAIAAVVNSMNFLRSQYLAETSAATAKYLDAIADFRRRQWVERRNWSYLLHGTIQASMSVIAIRLANLKPADRAEIERLSETIDHLIDTLKNPKLPEIDLDRSVETLRRLWAGICEIQFDVGASARKAIETDAASRFAINEILTEAVTNAIKHGKAKSVDIRLEKIRSGVRLEISNRGRKPAALFEKSIGSKMLDELSKNWTLNYEGGVTELRAELAQTTR